MPQRVKRAAIYKRVSDEEQKKGYSLPEQEAKCREALTLEGCSLKESHIFFDVFTGKYWRERQGLQAMLAAAKRHEFDIVYVTELDRLARNHIHQEIIREELRYYGVTTVSLNKEERADDDSLTGNIVRTIFGFLAEEERKKIVKRTQTGIQSRVEEGHLLPSRRPLYGYEWEDRWVVREGKEILVKKAAYVIKEDEAKVVVWIFELAYEGVSMRRIAIMLTEKGIPTPDGKTLWRFQTVQSILSNSFYTGQAFAYRYQWEFKPGEGMRRHLRPEGERMALPDGVVPALISQEVFDKVQEQLAYNKQMAQRNNKHPQRTLLRCGMVVCGYCGRNMTVQHSNTRNCTSYICSAERYGYHECIGVKIRHHLLDEVVWQKAREIIQDPDRLEAELVKKQINDTGQDSLEAIERLLKQVIDSIINLTQTIEKTKIPAAQEVLAQRLDVLVKQKQGYEEERDQLLRHQINYEEAHKAFIRFKEWCCEVRPRFDDSSYQPTYQEKREACERLGLSAVVYRQDHEPHFTVELSPPEIMSIYG
jgi:site-specific DNA recombinase